MMDLMAFMELMGTSEIPLLAALFIGLMTALSPCPMATNITAIAAISRKVGKPRHTILMGLAYTAGRSFAYAAIASLVVWAGLSTQAVSFFLQQYGERLLGPFLLLLGVLMLEVVHFPVIASSGRLEKLKEQARSWGVFGAFLLGVLFALAFCPFSAVLFFGMLIPLALVAGDGVFIPTVFAIGTGLPVIAVSLILSQGVSKIGSLMGRMETLEKWMKRAVSAAFILVGLYYIIIIYLR